MAFYLVDNNGRTTYINNKYLRSRLVAGTIDTTDSISDSIDDLSEYPESVRTLISKIMVETPIYSIRELIDFLINLFSEDSDKEYRNALLTLEKSHLLTIVYLLIRGCINKYNVEQFLDMTTLRNRTELLLTFLERETKGVNIFSQLENKVGQLSNFKNINEVYNSTDYNRITYYLTRYLTSGDYLLSDYFYDEETFRLKYIDYKTINSSGTSQLKELFNSNAISKWAITEYDYDNILREHNIDELESNLRLKTQRLYNLQKNVDTRMFSTVPSFTIETSEYISSNTTEEEYKNEMIRLASEIQDLRNSIIYAYYEAGSYDNSDSIRLNTKNIIEKSVSALLPEIVNYKYINRMKRTADNIGTLDAFYASFISEFNRELKSGNPENKTRTYSGGKNITLPEMKDRYFYTIVNDENTFSPANFFLTNPTSEMFDKDSFRLSSNELTPLYHDMISITDIVSSGINNTTRNVINTNINDNLKSILDTNLLSTSTSCINYPTPGVIGMFSSATINNYKFYSRDDEVSFDVTLDISEDGRNSKLSLEVVGLNENNDENVTYEYNVNISNIGSEDEDITFEVEVTDQHVLQGTNIKLVPSLEFFTTNNEPEFTVNLVLALSTMSTQVDDEGNTINEENKIYGDTVSIHLKKISRQGNNRYLIDNFGTSCIQNYFNEVIYELNTELIRLNGKEFEVKNIGVSLKEYIPKLKKKCIELIPTFVERENGKFLYAFVFDIILYYLDYLLDDSLTDSFEVSIREETFKYYQEQFFSRQLIISFVDLLENLFNDDDFNSVRELIYSLASTTN